MQHFAAEVTRITGDLRDPMMPRTNDQVIECRFSVAIRCRDADRPTSIGATDGGFHALPESYERRQPEMVGIGLEIGEDFRMRWERRIVLGHRIVFELR